jgi:hypothetical protein
MVSFTEMLGLFYEFSATLSAAFVIESQLVKSSTFYFIVGWVRFCGFYVYNNAIDRRKIVIISSLPS